MTISVWRYSHLALAVSSFLLLTLAAITGIILAFQPVSEKLQPYRTGNFSELTLAQSLPALRERYPDINELTIDANHFVQAKGTDQHGNKLHAYIDPQTGKVLGHPGNENEFFLWVTALHRSLFIHEAGRFFIGLTSFLLLLITVSGTMLVIQRQRGLKRFFTPIVKDNFAQFYHVVLGRWSLIPIFIIALSGTYLSLARFGFFDVTQKQAQIDFDAIRSAPVKKAADFEIFKTTKLSQVESVEFPFSEDVEDYYILKLKDREVTVNQITGDILGEVRYPAAVFYTNLSLDLHTGRTSGWWAVILAVASANILFFIYSGFAITLKRRANRIKNKYKADESKFIILVGSENGSTFRFAQAVHKQLLKAGEKSFITELNSYTVFPNAEHFIIMAATYGLGDAPTNASRFASQLEKYPQQRKISYSIAGFGSHAYPDFCKFSFEIGQLLTKQSWAVALTDIHTIADKCPNEFSLWAEAWSQQTGIELPITDTLNIAGPPKLDTFTVTDIVPAATSDGAFMLSMKGKRGLRVTSGDLLAIYPENDHRERLYSIGVVKKQIQLSVRLHPGGLGSGFLHRFTIGAKFKARIASNEHFHFPAKAPEVIMISNGTGIAPFLGMIDENGQKATSHLYCGFRDKASYKIHQDFLEQKQAAGKLGQLHVAFSREETKQYVSHLISRDSDLIANVLSKGGVLMICGSLSMQKDVMIIIEAICKSAETTASFYQSRNQIMTDCY